MKKTISKLACILTAAAILFAMTPFNANFFKTPVRSQIDKVYAEEGGFVDDNDPTVPHVGFDWGNKERYESSYNGHTIWFRLWDQEQGPYDPDGKLAKLKRGKKHDMSNVVRATSSDTSVAAVKQIFWDKDIEWEKDDDISCQLALTIFKPGKTTITFYDAKYGKKLEALNLKISQSALINNWKDDLSVEDFYYGNTRLTARARGGDKIVLKVKGKTYTKTAAASGKAVFNMPLLKPETEGTVTFYKKGYSNTSVKLGFEVADDFVQVDIAKIKKGAKKITLTIKWPVKGDKIKIKAGNKTYTKKVKKTAKISKFKIKVKKLEKGAKVQVRLYSKFKTLRAGDSVKVK